jgi:hypothetical protein
VAHAAPLFPLEEEKDCAVHRVGILRGENAVAIDGSAKGDTKMSVIAFTTFRQRNPQTGRVEDIVDRAFNLATERSVVLPAETPQALGATWDNNLGLWVLDQDRPAIGARQLAA